MSTMSTSLACGVSRTRVSATVDSELLMLARTTRAGKNDAELIDAALAALVGQHRATEIDNAYTEAYTAHPYEQPDEWGDLASFREAAAQ